MIVGGKSAGRATAALCAALLGVFAACTAAGAYPQRAVCPGPAAEGYARCHAHVVVDVHGAPATSFVPPGYGPAQFHGAYALPASAPALQTIAIVDAYDDPTVYTDLTNYDKTYGIPNPPLCSSPAATAGCFVKVNQSGATTPLPSKNAGWALEIALDVETAHEICQQNCKIVLVEASSSSGANLDAAEETAVRLGANEISNSWGTNGEYSGELLENAHFNHPGIAITVASGDNGYERFGFPAASPDVVDAGGTTLNVSQSGGSYSRSSELAWSGSGSGCSLYFGAPAWQATTSGWPATGCLSSRGVADVAADADPNTGASVYDTTRYNGRSGWFQVGGTSLASPLIAGVYALADNAASAEADPSGYPASIAYAKASALYDVKEGPSTGSCSTTACQAGTGYDGPTGLGTPTGLTGF